MDKSILRKKILRASGLSKIEQDTLLLGLDSIEESASTHDKFLARILAEFGPQTRIGYVRLARLFNTPGAHYYPGDLQKITGAPMSTIYTQLSKFVEMGLVTTKVDGGDVRRLIYTAA